MERQLFAIVGELQKHFGTYLEYLLQIHYMAKHGYVIEKKNALGPN